MDLYRVLRISLYLLAASGALALSIAEESFIPLLAVLLFAAAAFVTVDSQRIKPVRVEYALCLVLALLLYVVIPLRLEGKMDKLPATVAHVLCALQALLFFCPYSAPIFFAFCASALGLVILSGVMCPDVSLLIRIGCFAVLTAWTLFVHALWRAREIFNRRAAANRSTLHAPGAAAQFLPQRAFWQALRHVTGLACACLAGGLLLLCFVPHLNENVVNYLESFWETRSAVDDEPGIHEGRGRGEGILVAGPGGIVDDFKGNSIQPDQRLALRATFSKPLRDLAGKEGRIYMRTGAFSLRQNDRWLAEDPRRKVETHLPDGALQVSDPSVGKIVAERPEIKQEIRNLSKLNRTCCALGSITKLTAPVAVEQDNEGTLYWTENEQVDSYTLWSPPPLQESSLPDDAEAEHKNYLRYVRQTGLPAKVLEDVRRRALEITAHCETAPEKVRAILDYLRGEERYRYALDFPSVPLHEFILRLGGARGCGHCQRFASAFVVLCRLNDLPARLAVGFCAPVDERQMEAGAREISFKNSDAHAWGEVYFKGLGWAVCDPTPARAPGSVKTPPPVAAVPPPEAPNAPPPPQGFFEKLWNGLLHFNSREQRAMYNRLAKAVDGALGGAGATFAGETSSGWLGAFLAWATLGIFLFFFLQMLLRQGPKYKSAAPPLPPRARAAAAFYNDLLQVLARRGFLRRPEQTPREFAEVVVRRGGETFQPVFAVTAIFEQVRYGGAELSQEEYNRLQSALDVLREAAFLPANVSKT
jgi:hypothetical protein